MPPNNFNGLPAYHIICKNVIRMKVHVLMHAYSQVVIINAILSFVTIMKKESDGKK